MTKTSIYEIKGKIALLVLLLVGLFIIGIGYNEKSDKKNIYISEICSHNDTIVYDNYGDFHDYIELHNRGNESVDLDGWYLTDSLNDVSNRRLLLDEIVLEGGDYYIAFVAKELCDYALSEGDCIYLFDSSGKEVDAVKVPKIDDEKSYAFLEDEGKWVNNLASTPGKKNENITIEVETEVLGKAFIPEFSVESGFYNTDFYLEMETEEGCEIYYTVDGSRPTTESILYNGPIYISDATKKPNKWCERTDLSVIDYEVPNYLVDKCTIIRAASFDKDGRCSEEKAASYFVDFDGRYGYGKGYTVSIISEPDNLFSDEKGIYVIGSVGKMNHDTLDLGYNAIVNYTKDGKGWRRPAIIHVFDENKNCIYQQEILLGIHGGYSTREVQKSFNLIAKEGERILPGLFGDKHESLILRAGGVNDTASTKIRDVLNQSLVEERNITTQKAFPCQVFLDGEYWGLYNLQERLDPAMIASKYNISKDNIILLKNGNVLGKDNTYSNYYKQVLDYAKSNDLSKTEKYRIMETLIDVQSYIEYCCMEIYCANSDSFANNYALWRTIETSSKLYEDGKWRWIVFDTDDSTGMLTEGKTDAQIDSFVEGHWHWDPMDDPLFSALVRNEEFRTRFANTFYDMCEKEYDIDRVYGFIDKLERDYMEGCVLSHRRFYNSQYSEEEYIEKLSTVSFFYASREYFIVPYMEEHIVNYAFSE